MTCEQPMRGLRTIDRSDVPGVRRILTSLGAVVAEVDEQLRYVWIDNSLPDFDAKSVIGRRDDQLFGQAKALEIMAIKREAFDREAPISGILTLGRSNGNCYYTICAYPICGASGKIDAILTVAFDTTSEKSVP